MFNDDVKRVFQSDKQWYKKIWTLCIQNQSWIEETKDQVDFICDVLKLKGNEKILDLACGFGRHSLELGKRGFSVTGIDITKDYIEEAKRQAQSAGVNNVYHCMDVRDVQFKEEFDVVLNMADGAIGYLEDDEENEKIFAIAGRALKKGGKYFIDICNASYAQKHFPVRNWQYGEKAMALADFTWDKEKRIMYFAGIDLEYGKPVQRENEIYCDPIRLYSVDELGSIYKRCGMAVTGAYGNFHIGEIATDDTFQMQVTGERI
ncbi:MAG TPA: class I SAM-dependent methyltransferase [Treponemataceae bacterium]|jgi:SAM-dependent methyltransferase|nr:class I SAM-dependent methyltransferase [Treponemataceae bacterium]